MSARTCAGACAAVLMWACSVMPASAQGVGAIGGTVADTSGAVLPGVTVTLSNPAGTIGANQTATTDERGTFQFIRLVPGSYRVRAEIRRDVADAQPLLRIAIVREDGSTAAAGESGELVIALVASLCNPQVLDLLPDGALRLEPEHPLNLGAGDVVVAVIRGRGDVDADRQVRQRLLDDLGDFLDLALAEIGRRPHVIQRDGNFRNNVEINGERQSNRLIEAHIGTHRPRRERFIAALAELNRPPFDIPVGESEVVGGPFVEYSGIRWSMFFLGEYAGLFIMSVLMSAVFLGGYAWPFGQELGLGFQLLLTVVKAGLIIFMVMWIRASVPRLRIDQLMGYSWKILLPLVLVQLVVNGFVLVYGLPLITLTVVGLIGVVVLVRLTERSVQRPRAPRAAEAHGDGFGRDRSEDSRPAAA